MTAIFEGKFNSYSEAASYCEFANRNKTYPSSIWYKRQWDYVKSAKQGITPRSQSITDFVSQFESDLIVDFGGGSGWLYHLLKVQNLTNQKYHLIETAESLSLFANIISENTEFSSTTIEQALLSDYQAVNPLLYSNSVFQYISDYKHIVENLLKMSRWKYVMLDDIQITSGKSFWTCQRYYGYLNPYKFFNLEEILAPFLNIGFEIHSNIHFEANLSEEWEFQLETDDKIIQLEKSISVILKR